jgi:Lrp/AsnC family transcriptional regulator
MTSKSGKNGKSVSVDEVDREILRLMQQDSTLPLEQMAKLVGISKTAIWNRIQRLHQDKVILKQAAVINAALVGLHETFYVAVKTSQHDDQWLEAFNDAIRDLPEITEAHRLAGDMDYILKVQVGSTSDYDDFYKRLISRVTMYSVSSFLSMETLKFDSSIPI